MDNRKELKEAYKQMKFAIGVFQIRNTENGKIFVEGSMNLKAIFNRYKLQLEMGSHPSPSLQQDWKLYGPDKFVFEVLEEIEQKEDEEKDYSKDMKALEQLYLEELQPYHEKGYNRAPRKG